MTARISIDAQVCKGCLLCAATCPKQVLAQDMAAINAQGHNPVVPLAPENCIACAMCALICPDSAITVEQED